MGNNENPVDVQSYLSGVDYPASRQDLINEAKRQNADSQVLQDLQGIPDKNYKSPAEVSDELGGM